MLVSQQHIPIEILLLFNEHHPKTAQYISLFLFVKNCKNTIILKF